MLSKLVCSSLLLTINRFCLFYLTIFDYVVQGRLDFIQYDRAL